MENKKLSSAKESLPENLCEGCPTLGMCCSHAILTQDGVKIYLPSLPCKFIDTETKLCTVYEDRFEKNPFCHTMIALASKDGCPPECNYKDHIDFKVKRTRVASDLEEKDILVQLFKDWVTSKTVPFTLPEKIQNKLKRLIG